MRTIAKWFIFREAAPAEFRVFDRIDDVAICVDKVHHSRNADRSALRVHESFHAL